MRDDRDFEHLLREALHREAEGLPLRIDAMTVQESMTRTRRRIPAWVLPIAVPVGFAVVLAVIVLSAPPASPPLAPGSAVSATTPLAPAPSGPPSEASAAATPGPTPHPANRTAAAVAHGADRLYVIGGRAGASPLESGNVFDGLTWNDLPLMPQRRVHAAAVITSDLRLFVFGGQSPTGEALDTTLVLEPEADAWADGPPMPVAQSGMAGVEVDGRAYLFGGSAEGHERDVLVLDLETGLWQDGTPMPVAPENPIAASVGSDAYVLSGPVALRYRGDSGTWESLAEPPLIGFPRAVVAANDKLWLVGGTRAPGDRYPGVAYFDPSDNTWRLTDAQLPPGNMWLHVYPSGDRLTVMGGHRAGMTTTIVEMADS
ncbi:MAG: hypothetical protein H0U86_15920 [Chloroflexi bacterium]|nr:hypothetical protein [Chloroflexota bacterium]